MPMVAVRFSSGVAVKLILSGLLFLTPLSLSAVPIRTEAGRVTLPADGERRESSAQQNQRIIDDSVIDVPDVPGLPSALLIGDSISMYLTRKTRQLLDGRANLHRIPENGRSTQYALSRIDRWLGQRQWDIIHFNWGLHDLLIVANGHNAVPPRQYEANLRLLVARLRRTGAKLIWATTTPVPDDLRVGPAFGPLRRNRDVVAYNRIARRIMEEQHILIDDLYALAAPRLAELQNRGDVHYTPYGSNILAGQVAAEILARLTETSANKGPRRP